MFERMGVHANLARWRIGTLSEKPRLDDGGEVSARHVPVEQLLRVVPAHTALRYAATN